MANTGNCGNISSGVGPFSVDEALVPVVEGNTQVRIWNTNTNALIAAQVPVVGGKAACEGDFTVAGVPSSGAEISMNWAGTVGAKTGKLLPTGNPIDKLKLESGKELEYSVVDAANPLVFLHAEDFGLTGSELVDAINNNTQLIEQIPRGARESSRHPVRVLAACPGPVATRFYAEMYYPPSSAGSGFPTP